LFCRYIQAANTPKDVLVLMDSGSSMSANGAINLAKETVKKIVETLGENDFFNVINVKA